MRPMLRPLALLAALLPALLAGPPALAADTPAPAGGGGGILALLPEDAATRHQVAVAGRTLDYTARAGTIALRDGEGRVTAAVFHVAYTLEPADPARPVTFVFNGGPGAAAAYLHLGALGPRVLATGPDGRFLPPPERLVDNPDTWLAFTDLVFVDPPGTGYSRAADPDKEADFWSTDRDAAAMTAFVRLWLARADRTAAPVYLAGESYGGYRAALLARRLQEDAGVAPSGVVLISPALEFSRVLPDSFDPLAPALLLPSLAAVHLEADGVRGAEALAGRLGAVEAYALGPYLTAQAAGLATGGRQTSARVADLTGLAPALVARHFGRIDAGTFAREARRDEGLALSVYDGTLAVADVAPAAAGLQSPDPVLDRSVPALTAAFVDYVRGPLAYRTDLTYRLLDREVSRRWDYRSGRQGYAGVLDDLQQARALQPQLSVLIVHGYTDLVTPYFATRWLVGQLPDLPGTAPIRLMTTEGGHMMYLRADARHALAAAAAATMAPKGP